MEKNSTTDATPLFSGEAWFDPIDAELRERIRVWRKVKTDWEAWTRRDLAQEDVVRLILDGSVVRVRLDRKATNISLLVVLGVRRDGQKILLAAQYGG